VSAIPGEVCENCGRRVPVPHEDKTPRQRAQYNVAIPKDAVEDGEQILRALIEACREVLKDRLSVDGDTPAYYVLVPVLSDWLDRNAR
jgi:hypothetical protein